MCCVLGCVSFVNSFGQKQVPTEKLETYSMLFEIQYILFNLVLFKKVRAHGKQLVSAMCKIGRHFSFSLLTLAKPMTHSGSANNAGQKQLTCFQKILSLSFSPILCTHRSSVVTMIHYIDLLTPQI